MSDKPTFKYFYGAEADMFNFYRLPKALFTNDYFKELFLPAKVLYGIMLDRMSLSIKNHWFDDQNRPYIYFGIEDAIEYLNCSKGTAVKAIQALDEETGIGLIEKCRHGQGKANRFYVKSFVVNEKVEDKKADEKSVDNFSEFQNLDNKNSKIWNSRSLKNELQEVQNLNPNNTKNNNTLQSDTESNLIVSDDRTIRVSRGYDAIGEADAYAELIKSNIEYECLMERYQDPSEREIVDGLYALILETVLCKNEYIHIAGNKYPANLVKSKFEKLEFMHVQYVMDMMRKNTTKVRNIKKYMLAALFNAPTTMTSYYQAEVNHDFPQYVGTGTHD